MRVYQIERKATGTGDVEFLERVFHKLLINFTWWVNRKDAEGSNVFQGGFLGLDNIGVFNRSEQLPGGARLDQSDGTSWMAMFCLNMLAIALELARGDRAYEDVATKFLEHFFHIAHAMNDRARRDRRRHRGPVGCNEDEFYYDLLRMPDGRNTYIRVRSMVGLIPLLAVETMDAELLERLPGFPLRVSSGFFSHRADLVGDAASVTRAGESDRRLFAVVNATRLAALLRSMLDEAEFLSPHGLRSLSRWHADQPFTLRVNGRELGTVDYEPAESRSGLFGGNSNWRGPVWFPLNYLIIEALQKFDWYYGSTFTVEYPDGLRTPADALGGVGGAVAAADRPVRPTGRTARGVRRRRPVPVRSALARSHTISRILPRRRRRRPRRVAPDRLDGARRQAHSAERGAGRQVAVAGAGAAERATAARTAGATLVPNSSIARSTRACGIVPTLTWARKRSLPNSSCS